EYRKTGILLFDKSTLIVGLVALVAGYLLRDIPTGIFYLLYLSLYILFFLSIAGKWDQELLKPYIFLLPARPIVKIWYATAAVHLKHLFEGLLLFFIAGWYFKLHIITCFLLAFCFTGFGSLYVYTGILFHKFIGKLSDTIIMRVVIFFLILFITSPAITLLIITNVEFADSQNMQWLFMTAVVAYSALISFLALLLGRNLFTNMDKAAV
ncbi:MAG: hypothetical protein HN368_15660, partial [Spirochaetales bacterium]|nr:hypothetical protein [Spirochaetales bacterium]